MATWTIGAKQARDSWSVMKLLCTAWVLVMAPDIACDASAWLASRCCCSLSEPHVAVHPQAHGFFRAFKAVPASCPLARRASMASVPWSSAIRESRHACTKGGSHCDTLRNFRLSVICRFTARLSVRLAHGPRPRSPSLNSSTSSISPSGSSLISSPSVRFPCLRGHSTSRREQIGDRYMCTCQTRSNRVKVFELAGQRKDIKLVSSSAITDIRLKEGAQCLWVHHQVWWREARERGETRV